MPNRFDNTHKDDAEAFEQFAPSEPSEPTEPRARAAPTLSANELHQRIKHRAVSYLSRREYGQAELKRKLMFAFAEQPFAPNDQFDGLEALIDHVLTHLAQNNWQSDARFAAQIGKVKGERYGAARIKHTLNQQGLSKELIDETVAELAQSELQRAHAVWQKKFGAAPSNASEYAKQSRFLAYRGFSFDVIKKVIQGKDLEWDE